MKQPCVSFVVLLFAVWATAALDPECLRSTPNNDNTAIPNIGLESVSKLRSGVDKWPLILDPRNPQEQRINAVLIEQNNRLKQALDECDAELLQSSEQMDVDAKERSSYEPKNDWSRKVKITMAGPRFLSFVEKEDWFCGGAYPNHQQIALVFDLVTGSMIDWSGFVAKSANASSIDDSTPDGSLHQDISMAALQKLALTSASHDCRDVFKEGSGWPSTPSVFQVWPDAKTGTLLALPSDLPHVIQSCAVELHLTLPQARQLGFNETILGAIEQAHRQIAVTPKPNR